MVPTIESRTNTTRTLTSKARRAFAQKPVDTVYTFASVIAGLWIAVIDVLATVCPLKPLLTNAGV